MDKDLREIEEIMKKYGTHFIHDREEGMTTVEILLRCSSSMIIIGFCSVILIHLWN